MSFSQFVQILIARRAIFFGALILVLIGTSIAAVSLPRRYPATARVLMDVVRPDPVSEQVISSGAVRSYTRTQVELISDYRVAGEVVDRLKWNSDPTRVAQFQKDNNGNEDFGRYWARQIISNTTAGVLQNSNIIEISYESADPAESRAVVGALRDAYIAASLKFRVEGAGRSAAWYVDQAEKARVELSKTEARKAAFQQKNNIIVGPNGSDIETAKLESLQSAILSAQNMAGLSQASTERTITSTGLVQQLRSELNTLDDQISQASQKLGPANPLFVALQERRRVLQGQLSRETVAARATGGSADNLTRANISRLQSELDAQRTKVLAMKSVLDELAQLQREVDLRRSQYEKASSRTADLKLEASVSDTGLVALGDPVVSGSPSFPNVPLLLGAGAAVGVVLGLLGAILVEISHRRVRGKGDLVRASGVPVLAVIPDRARHRRYAMWRRVLGLFPPEHATH